MLESATAGNEEHQVECVLSCRISFVRRLHKRNYRRCNQVNESLTIVAVDTGKTSATPFTAWNLN